MAENVIPRDVRIDQLGFAGELQKQHVDSLKTAVKVRMNDEELDRVRGDYFEGQLVPTVVTTIDPGALLALYSKSKITRAELLSCLSVKKEPLAAFLTGKEIEAMSTKAEGSPQLRVTRIKGVEVGLTTALKGLGDSIAAG